MPTLVGTKGADTLVGDSSNDTIRGMGGDDRLSGGGGRDLIEQTVYGHAVLDGGDGEDALIAHVGDATLLGGAGADHITAYEGLFVIDAGPGDDLVSLNIFPRATVTLGAGADSLVVGVRAGLPPLVVTDFQPGEGGDRFEVTLPWDLAWDSSANPFGNGRLRLVQDGADVVLRYDVAGIDRYGVLDLVRFQNVQVGQFTAYNTWGWSPDGSPAPGQSLAGTPGADWLGGGLGPDSVAGGGGADELGGGIGHDTLSGDSGDDTLGGGSGNDQLFGGEGNDSLSDYEGSNFIRGGEGDDLIEITGSRVSPGQLNDLHGNQGADTLRGGQGADWVVGGQGNDMLSGGLGGDVVYGNLGDDVCEGGDGNDWVRGGQGDDSLAGGAGDDFISGDRGNDTISGGSGADAFHSFSGAGVDRIRDFNAGEGDRLNLLAGTTYTLRQDPEDIIVDMGNGDQVILMGLQISWLPAGWITVG